MKMLANTHEFGVSDKEFVKKEKKDCVNRLSLFLTASVNVVLLVVC